MYMYGEGGNLHAGIDVWKENIQLLMDFLDYRIRKEGKLYFLFPYCLNL